MKTCTNCHESKPISEFYTMRAHKGGKDCFCKDCRKKISNAGRASRKMPQSTADVMEQLKKRGIPVSVGCGVGLKGYDLAAYGCIPVEAKGALPINGRKGQYNFAFTKAQMEKYRNNPIGFIVLAAYGKETRYFVIPAASGVIDFNKAAFCLHIEPSYYLETWEKIKQYEGAFHLIAADMLGKAVSIKIGEPATKQPMPQIHNGRSNTRVIRSNQGQMVLF